uniref:T cell receptor gamma variable 5 n=1 Tax=Astyanax mexicanus TaxID=7994 RepID=A0A8B9GNN4_ASTMX
MLRQSRSKTLQRQGSLGRQSKIVVKYTKINQSNTRQLVNKVNNYVHWYQQKDGEALKRILYVNKQATSTVHDPNHPEAKDFSVTLEKGDNYVLKVGSVKLNHAGVYYCAVWTSSHSEKNCSHPVQ